jgi:Mg-chelatase subunit ChlD
MRYALVLLLVVASASARAADEPGGVRVLLDSPRPQEVVRSRIDMAPLAGSAAADGLRPASFDVVLVIDISGSTAYPSGLDVDNDGVVGESQRALVRGMPDTKNTDPEDSVLAAEIVAATTLLDGLNSQRVRVGVVSFSGEIDPATGRRRSEAQQDAWLEAPLTDDYGQVRQALQAILLRGPSGGTNMEAGVKLALRELAGLSGAQSQPRPDAKKVVLFLTDGRPSLPFGMGNKDDREDYEAVQAAARVAHLGGVSINVYGLGPEAIDYPVACTEMAKLTNGLYTPVRRPGDIVAALSGVSFANVDDVVAVNLTIGEMSGPDDIQLNPDGSFSGFVPARKGRNRVRVSALASDGTRGSTEVEFDFAPQELTDNEIQRELERIRKRNRDLLLDAERRKQEEFRKRERQRSIEIKPEQ